MNYNFSKVAIEIPQILLPSEEVDLGKWSVIACDQYTSQPEYWKNVEEHVQNEPSSLDLIFPEVYLNCDDGEERIKAINSKMMEFLGNKNLREIEKPGFVLVDRKTAERESRKGLVVSIDLEGYDYKDGSSSLIRATEGTIVDRLPPRMKVRKDAQLEVPHIMVLIDDPDKTVIEPLFDHVDRNINGLKKIYDFELMQQGGHLKGYAIDQKEQFTQIYDALVKLADKENFSKKYNAPDKAVLLYAMGDGNHSLATAKAIWEEAKADCDDNNIEDLMKDPARYALVELVNVHDDGLHFEPIHRVLFDLDIQAFFAEFKEFYSEKNCQVIFSESEQEMHSQVAKTQAKNNHIIPFVADSKFGFILVENSDFIIELATYEDFLVSYLKSNEVKVDFIHGSKTVTELGSKNRNIGFFFPPISKHDLFKTIIFDGALPRKTFSLGKEDEKRFYLETRKIK